MYKDVSVRHTQWCVYMCESPNEIISVIKMLALCPSQRCVFLKHVTAVIAHRMSVYPNTVLCGASGWRYAHAVPGTHWGFSGKTFRLATLCCGCDQANLGSWFPTKHIVRVFGSSCYILISLPCPGQRSLLEAKQSHSEHSYYHGIGNRPCLL